MPSAVEVVRDAAVLVEDAHDDRLAVHARQRHDAQVDVLAVDRQADAAVLRDAPLGDVEVAHDLDAGDRRRRPCACGIVAASCSTPSTRKRTRSSRPSGSKWMSEAPCSTRLGDDRVDELDDRRVVGGLAQVDDLGDVGRRPPRSRRGRRSSRRLRRVIRARDVLAARRRPAGPRCPVTARCRRSPRTLPGRPSRRSSVVSPMNATGTRLVALGLRRADEVRGGHVDLEDREVDVVEAVALGDRARELLLVQDALLQEGLLEGRAGDPRRLVGVLDAFAVGEPELDDDVGQEALAAAASAGG